MFFDGCVREIGVVRQEVLRDFRITVEAEFSELWKNRTMLIMKNAKVLKAKSPTDIDCLGAGERDRLWHLMQPILDELRFVDHTITYADVSSIPGKTWVDPHIDSILMHAVARRIHIPLITNPKVTMGFVTKNGSIEKQHLKVGVVYEVNNILPHCVYNGGTDERWHILLDVVPDDLLQLIQQREMLVTVAPVVNHIFSPITVAKLRHACSQP